MRKFNNILLTGGAGFIGSNLIHFLFKQTDFDGKLVNLDKLTYASNIENVAEIENMHGGKRYFFEQIDICDAESIKNCMIKYDIDCVIHLAAESHVDRSILDPGIFINTNIVGTYNLLEAARTLWGDRKDVLFHHVSTDEVFGSLGATGYFYEDTPYDPRSPYSASKASSDHLVKAYFHTFGLPVTISNCSNNYGPYQFPEKLIPLVISNILNEKNLPVYGDGQNIRDWLFVTDHCSGIWSVVEKGRIGETYNIGGENEWTNIELVKKLCELMAEYFNKETEHYKHLITFVKDRAGHDRRYAINCDKIKNDCGWSRSVDFEKGLKTTVSWYMNKAGK